MASRKCGPFRHTSIAFAKRAPIPKRVHASVPLIAAALCCSLLYGCGSPVQEAAEPAVATINHDPPPEPGPGPAYVPRTRGTLSFSADIAPIVFEKCASCHRPGEIGPFPLLAYTDVKKRTRQIVDVTQKRIMPPWSGVPGYCVYEHDGSLTTEEIGKIAQWTDEGAPEGNPSDLPPLPQFTQGWQFGQPDLVVHMSEAYSLPADVSDTTRKFVIHVPIKERKYVKGWDFNPGNTKIVHHGILHIDQSGWPRHLDEADPLPGYDGGITEGDRNPEGFNLSWLPGTAPPPPDDNISWPLDPGTDLVLELHLCGTGKTEPVQASIALYFATKPPTTYPFVIALKADAIDIPPGERAYVVRDEYVLPADVKLITVGPHAHYRGKDVQVWSILPDGSKSWLLRVKDWNFNWQNQYTFAEPLELPKGTALCMAVTFDNSAENPRNPDIPPKRVLLGRKSTDEMAEITFSLLLPDRRNAANLQRDYGLAYTKKTLAQHLFQNRCDPNHAETHYNLGTDYQSLGDLNLSAKHYEESVRLNPNNSWARNNLGSIYSRVGRPRDAITQYAAAIRIDPKDAKAQNNLGLVHLMQGDVERAVPYFEAALEINHDFPEAEYNLGNVAVTKRDFTAATMHFERALKSNPRYEPAREALKFLNQQRGDQRNARDQVR